MAASVYFNREASQRSIHFLEKYYSREYLNVKITHSKQFQGGMCVGERERERGGGGGGGYLLTGIDSMSSSALGIRSY